MASKFTAESGHWYAQDGEPMYTLIGKNGKERRKASKKDRKRKQKTKQTVLTFGI